MISVLIPTLNNEKTIRFCLESLQRQSIQPDEIIVIDGYSSDNTVEIAKKYQCTILFEEKKTRAAACNTGLKNAAGDIIIFTDGDCIAKENWIEELVKGFEQDSGGIIAAVTGPNVEYPGESLFGRAVNAIYSSVIGGKWSEQSQSIFNQKPRYVKSAAGCNVAYRRKYFDEVGVFNENLITAEDSEINFRLTERGYKIYFNPSAIVYHRRPQNHKSFRNKARKYAEGKVQLFRIHQYGIKAWHLFPPFYMSLLALLAFGSIFRMELLYSFLFFFGLYILIVLCSTLVAVIRHKEFRFLYLLPIMFIEGHLWWSIGFFKKTFGVINEITNRNVI
ncbi:MAG: glycosyltransferase [Candidatus Heimdallarchaeaceae archaeon]